MPHLFVNRPRLYDLTRGSTELKAQFRWETINAVLYKIGGIVFIVGSVLFFPRFEAYADIGAWTFFFGSLLYLVVTGHDMAEAIRYHRSLGQRTLASDLELIAAAAYLVGTILFTFGSIFFLSRVGWIIPGAWCFVIGSLLFVLGACINVLQIVRAQSRITLQLMNLTAVSFVVGSVLFTVASVPYLWSVAPEDREILYGFLAWQYLIGSSLFLLGGIFNYLRAYLVIKKQINESKAG
ncbi:hypothetical protein AUP74_02444 [Microbulbifer aggregans]|uniref:YrhK domain-containing protein n=1 Tax=Microbulbifer aggregans TaxID=1769779 RepID=A0A1C9W9K9_9GAMM|nr:YrhK family protein [Microbulbifer aggregans]AOS97846.1 hypothetical protein AUP74_02444 [Microbulbifer aggregans]